jgi:hypothetical protein
MDSDERNSAMSTPDAPSVSESSDLEDDELDVISLSEIPTIQDLYKKETLRPAKSAKYPPIKSYLRRVSLWQVSSAITERTKLLTRMLLRAGKATSRR